MKIAFQSHAFSVAIMAFNGFSMIFALFYLGFQPLSTICNEFHIKRVVSHGSARVEDNDNLTNLTLLPNVTKIGKTFELSFNHGITELHGPPQLHQLPGG